MSAVALKTIPEYRSRFVVEAARDIQRAGGSLPFFTSIWRENGDFARVQIGPRVFYLAVHPDYVRQVLITNRQNYDKLHSYDIPRRLLLGNGLFSGLAVGTTNIEATDAATGVKGSVMLQVKLL